MYNDWLKNEFLCQFHIFNLITFGKGNEPKIGTNIKGIHVSFGDVAYYLFGKTKVFFVKVVTFKILWRWKHGNVKKNLDMDQ